MNFAVENQLAGWEYVRIDEILQPLEDGKIIHQGWSPRCEKEPSTSDDQWGVLKTTAIQAGAFQPQHNKLLPDHLDPRARIEVHVGDVLLTCAGPRTRCGVACMVRSTRPRLMLSGKMYRFRPDPERVDPRYLEAFLLSSEAWNAIDLMKTGGSESGLNLTHGRFRELMVPVAPLEDQKRIVADIEKQFSRLDQTVASLKRVKANLKRYRAAVLKAAVEGKLTEEWRKQNPDVEPASKLVERILAERRTKWEEAELAKMKAKGKSPNSDKWRERYKVPSRPDTSALSALPVNWAWSTWDEISTWVTYGFTRPMEHVQTGVPIVTAKHVAKGRIDFVNTHKTPVTAYENLSEKDRPQCGDILITKDGTIGRAAVVPEHSGFCINQSVAVIWLRNCPLSRQFLLAVIQSGLTQGPIAERARGVAIKHLSITDFAKLPVPVAPLEEQSVVTQSLDAQLSIVEEVENEATSELLRCSRLRQSILSLAFSGRRFAGGDKRMGTTD